MKTVQKIKEVKTEELILGNDIPKKKDRIRYNGIKNMQDYIV